MEILISTLLLVGAVSLFSEPWKTIQSFAGMVRLNLILLWKGFVMTTLGIAALGRAILNLGLKALRISRKWQPAPKQTFEPGERNRLPIPVSPVLKNRIIEALRRKGEQDIRLIEVDEADLKKIGSKRPVVKK